MFEIFGIPSQALFGQLLHRADQRLVLRAAEPRARRHLRHAQHHQFHPWRPVHDGRLRGLLSAAICSGSATGGRSSSRRSWSASPASSIERLFLQWLYQLDHLYGLLLTFGLALIIEGVFRNYFGSSGLPYACRTELQGGQNLGFMFLPNYRAWVIVFSLVVCLTTWFVIERTRLGAYLRAATENPTLVRAFGINVPRMITLTYGFGVGARGARRRDGGADLQRQPADGRRPHHRGVRGGGDRRHGLDHGRDRHRLRRSASSKG